LKLIKGVGMIIKWFMVVGLLFFMGCSSKSTVVLIENGKTQNAVIVTTDKGSQTLDSVGSFVNLTAKDRLPSEIKIMSKKEIAERFKEVIAITPNKAKSFILYFEQNGVELLPKSKQILLDAIDSIAKRTPCMVDIIGHTDTTGSNQANMVVSLKRAKYIASVLEKRGIPLESLLIKGYGEEDLLVATPDNQAEVRNRNVEIFVK